MQAHLLLLSWTIDCLQWWLHHCFLTQDLKLSLPALAQSPRCKSFAAATTESWCFFLTSLFPWKPKIRCISMAPWQSPAVQCTVVCHRPPMHASKVRDCDVDRNSQTFTKSSQISTITDVCVCVSTKWQPTCIHFLQYDDDNLYIYIIPQVWISILNQPSKPATKILSNLICSPQDLGDDTLVAWINGLRSTLVTCPFVLKGSTHEISRDEAPLLQLGADIDRDLWYGNFRYNFTFLAGFAPAWQCSAPPTTSHRCAARSPKPPKEVLQTVSNMITWTMDRKGVRLGVSWTGSHAAKIWIKSSFQHLCK